MATNKSDPFNPFTQFDFNKFNFSDMLGNLKVPGVDMEGMVAAQRKNIEALTEANKVAVQGMQAVAKRQAEILAQAMGEVSAAAQQISTAGGAQEMSATQAELTKEAFEKALANMRELAEMVAQSNNQTFDVINKRFAESLEELKSLMAKR